MQGEMYCFYLLAVITCAFAIEEEHIKTCQTKKDSILDGNQQRASRYVIAIQGDDSSPQYELCLAATENRKADLQPCNLTSQHQTWIRTDESMVIRNQYFNACLLLDERSNQNSERIILENCDASSSSQKWTCHKLGKCKNTLTIATYDIVLNKNGSILVANQASATDQCISWTFIKLNDTEDDEPRIDVPFCRAGRNPCPPPPSGLDSFLVAAFTAMTIIEKVGIPQENIGNIVGQKSCYEPEDTVIISCNPGFVVVTDKSSFRVKTCLDSGTWSDPKPVYCVRKYCGRPPHEWKAETVGESFRFGDVVRYECVPGWKGTSVTRLCGVDGNWVGRRPACVPECQYNITGLNGTIRSPNYPKPYKHLQSCEWFIEVMEGLRIVFWVRDFFLEPSSILTTDCYHDYFYITEFSETRKYCGSSGPHKWISSGNRLTVGFHSDKAQQFKGFKIEFSTWNETVSSKPSEPVREGSFPDEEDKTHVYIGAEYARYNLEVIYVFLAVLGIGTILSIVGHHIYDCVRLHTAVSPLNDDMTMSSREFQRRESIKRVSGMEMSLIREMANESQTSHLSSVIEESESETTLDE